jgi:hypothetical protein
MFLQIHHSFKYRCGDLAASLMSFRSPKSLSIVVSGFPEMSWGLQAVALLPDH